MRNFLISNLPSILIIAALLIGVMVLVIERKWDTLRGLAYKAMLLAEGAITGTKQGQNRFNTVFIEIYSLLPAWFRFFIPPETLKAALQEWYNDIKDYMDNGKMDASQPPQPPTTRAGC